jgi:gamma-glutamylcyclotransferase (GGCT)/AIG2-like uncharacterized protein YtfP
MDMNLPHPLVIILAFSLLPFSILFAGSKEANESLKKANTYVKDKDFDAADIEFQKAISESNSEGKYLIEYARFLYTHKKLYQGSLEYAKLALDKNYINSAVYRIKARSEQELGQVDDAMESYDLSLAEANHLKNSNGKNWEKEIQNTADAYTRFLYEQEMIPEAKIVFDETYLKLGGNYETDFLQIGQRVYESLAHIELGRLNFDLAEGYLEKSSQINAINIKNKKQDEVKLNLETELEIFKNRRRVEGSNPDYTYKIVYLFIPRTKISLTSLKGEAISVDTKLSENEIKKAKWLSLAFVRYWESLSNGKLKIEIKYEVADTTLISLTQKVSASENTAGGEIRIIDPNTSFSEPLTEIYGDTYESTDQYVFIWNGDGIATYANGGSKYYNINENETILRGFVHISSNRFRETGRPQLILHEMFHSIESIFGKGLSIDGKEDTKKKNFPNAIVFPELNFFKYHFDKTIPERLNSDKYSEKGWKNINFRIRNQKPKKITPASREINEELFN